MKYKLITYIFIAIDYYTLSVLNSILYTSCLALAIDPFLGPCYWFPSCGLLLSLVESSIFLQEYYCWRGWTTSGRFGCRSMSTCCISYRSVWVTRVVHVVCSSVVVALGAFLVCAGCIDPRPAAIVWDLIFYVVLGSPGVSFWSPLGTPRALPAVSGAFCFCRLRRSAPGAYFLWFYIHRGPIFCA